MSPRVCLRKWTVVSFIIGLLGLAVLSTSSLWAQTGYSHYRTITISHAKVPNTDLSGFPFLFSSTDATLATTANGGHVTSASGYDIIFTSDAAGTQRLNHEIESYNAATGQFIAWVNLPTLSHTTDTVIYMFYGNSSVNSSQENKAAVWDSNYIGVWHLGAGGSLSGADSTSNHNSSADTGANVSATAGMIGGGASLDGSSGSYLDMGTSTTLDLTGAFTLSAWYKKTGYTGAWEIFMSKCAADACNYELAIDGPNQDIEGVQNGSLIESGIVPALNQWHHVVEVSNGANVYF